MSNGDIANAAFAALSDGQREVALLAAKGVCNKEIARRLGLSVRAIESRRRHIYQKLGVETIAQIAIMACIAGLVTDWSDA